MKKKKNVKGLIKALKHKNSRIRFAALKALGSIKDARAVEPLVQALQDYNNKIRKAAAEALGKIKRSESG